MLGCGYKLRARTKLLVWKPKLDLIKINWSSASLYRLMIIDNNFNQVCCTLRDDLNNCMVELSHTTEKKMMHVHGMEEYLRAGFTVFSSWQIISVGTNQGQGEFKIGRLPLASSSNLLIPFCFDALPQMGNSLFNIASSFSIYLSAAKLSQWERFQPLRVLA